MCCTVPGTVHRYIIGNAHRTTITRTSTTLCLLHCTTVVYECQYSSQAEQKFTTVHYHPVSPPVHIVSSANLPYTYNVGCLTHRHQSCPSPRRPVYHNCSICATVVVECSILYCTATGEERCTVGKFRASSTWSRTISGNKSRQVSCTVVLYCTG